MASQLVEKLNEVNDGNLLKKAAERIKHLENQVERLTDGQTYLMDVSPEDLTIEDTFEAFGFTRRGFVQR